MSATNKSMNPEAAPFVSKAAPTTPNSASSAGPQQPVAQPMPQGIPAPHPAQGAPFRAPPSTMPPAHFNHPPAGPSQVPTPSFRGQQPPPQRTPHSPTYPGAGPAGYYQGGPPPQHFPGMAHPPHAGPMPSHGYQQPPVSFPTQPWHGGSGFHGGPGHQGHHQPHMGAGAFPPPGVSVHGPPMSNHHRNHQSQHHPHQPPPPHHHNHHGPHQSGAFPTMPVVPAPASVKVDVKRQAYIVLGGRRGQTEHICRRVAEDALPPNHLRYVKATTMDDAVNSTYAHPLMHLEQQLQECQIKPTNIIVDDPLVSSAFEAYYCEDILKKHFRVDTVFYLDYTLERMNAQEPIEQFSERIYHPLGFEVGCWYDEPGHGWLKKIAVYDADGNDRSTEDIAKEILVEIKRGVEEVTKMKGPPLFRSAELPPSTLIKGMTLVRDFALVCSIRAAVQPFVDDYFNAPSPQRLMEYAYFTRFAHQLRSYMVTHALIGVRGCLVGFNTSVYFLVSGCAALLSVDAACVPSAVQRHCGSQQEGLSFILDATCCALDSGRHVIYVADFLLLKEHKADALIWSERHELLQQEFLGIDHNGSSSHPASPNQASSSGNSSPTSPAGGSNNNLAPLTVALQQFWRLEEVDKLLHTTLPHSGFIFAGPGALLLKEFYNPTNYFFPKPEYRHVELRIWNARLQVETDPFITKAQGPVNIWAFDAFMLDENGVEQKVEYPVYISEEDVAKDFINDGNIVELVKDTVVVPVAPAGGAGTQGKSKTISASAAIKTVEKTVLRYVKRASFAVFPMSAVFVSGIWNPKWSTDGLARAMRSLKFIQRSRRRDDEEDANGGADDDRD